MKKSILLGLIAAPLFLTSGRAFAGFIATTGLDSATGINFGGNGANVGDGFSVNNGTFASFVADTPQDPQINGGDLNHYLYSLTATVAAPGGPYLGTYQIIYDLNSDHVIDAGDVRVSAGTSSLTATVTSPATAQFTGTLTQTQGPANPVFADLSYGGHDVLDAGIVFTLNPGQGTGDIQAVLRQTAQIPEPASMSLLALGGLSVLTRRRKA